MVSVMDSHLQNAFSIPTKNYTSRWWKKAWHPAKNAPRKSHTFRWQHTVSLLCLLCFVVCAFARNFVFAAKCQNKVTFLLSVPCINFHTYLLKCKSPLEQSAARRHISSVARCVPEMTEISSVLPVFS